MHDPSASANEHHRKWVKLNLVSPAGEIKAYWVMGSYVGRASMRCSRSTLRQVVLVPERDSTSGAK